MQANRQTYGQCNYISKSYFDMLVIQGHWARSTQFLLEVNSNHQYITTKLTVYEILAVLRHYHCMIFLLSSLISSDDINIHVANELILQHRIASVSCSQWIFISMSVDQHTGQVEH